MQRNSLADELAVGDSAKMQHTLQTRDVRAWSAAFGGGRGDTIRDGLVHDAAGMVTAMFALLASTRLPGPGALIRSTTVRLVAPLPVRIGVTVELIVQAIQVAEQMVVLDGQCRDVHGQTLATGRLEVDVATVRQEGAPAEHRLESLLARCQGLPPIPTGVVYPCSIDALRGALEAAASGLIVPVLFGPARDIQQLAADAGLALTGTRIVSADGPENAARLAAEAAGTGEVGALMKGSLHTDVFLHAVLQKEVRLRTGRLLSHCVMVSTPTYARRIILTDAALNIAPDTAQKRDICQNAIGFAIALGIGQPKVAVLAAVETVNTSMPATLDGAILAKMADRQQIVGGLVDGPLDLDAAVDVDAARSKGITSPVAGCADILLAPSIEAGNMVYKNLSFMADAQTAALVVGARVPLILTSRADDASTRCFSAAAAVLYAHAVREDAARILAQGAD